MSPTRLAYLARVTKTLIIEVVRARETRLPRAALRAQGHAEDRHRREPTQQQDAACHAAEDTDGENDRHPRQQAGVEGRLGGGHPARDAFGLPPGHG